MEQKDIEKLGAEVAKLDPKNEAHWNSAGFPNCNYLKEVCGFNVQGSTLVAHGFNVERDAVAKKLADAAGGGNAGDKSGDKAGDGKSEIKQPGPLPDKLSAEDRPPPFSGETWNEGTTLHRNKKAMETLLENTNGSLDILSRMTKKSGQARVTEASLVDFKKELERILGNL